MKEIIVNDIIEKCNGRLICGNKDDVCTNFKKDTREIKKGDTFIGIKGENFDGNKFFEEALKMVLQLVYCKVFKLMKR